MRSTPVVYVLLFARLTYEVYYRSTPQPPACVPHGVHPAYSSAPPGWAIIKVIRQNAAHFGFMCILYP